MSFRIIIIVLLLVSLTAFAKETNVPQVVKDTFTKLYPKVTDAKWEEDEKNIFEAEFKENGKEITLFFNNQGTLIETETTIQISVLPANIEKVVNKKFAGYIIAEAAKIVDQNGKVAYEIDITKGQLKKEVLFDKDGKFIKEAGVEKEDTEEDKD
jgi:hypothetical protein